MTFNPKWIKSTEVVKRDGSNTLIDDWNVGDQKKLILDELQIQDADGFTITDTTSVPVFHIDNDGNTSLKNGVAVNNISNESATDSTSALLTAKAIHDLNSAAGTSGTSGTSGETSPGAAYFLHDELSTTTTVVIDATAVIAKSVILDIEDNWGDATYIEFRQIDFWHLGVKLTHTYPADFTAYGTFYSGTLEPDNIYDTSTSKTGTTNNDGWVHSGAIDTRTTCVFDTPIEFDEIRINNGHHEGGTTNRGIQNVKIHISDDSITSLTYDEAIANSTLIYDGTFDEHVESDVEDEQTLTLIGIGSESSEVETVIGLLMSRDGAQPPEDTIIINNVTDDLIETWITAEGDPSIGSIPAGTWTHKFYVSVDNALGNTYLRSEIYKLPVDGTSTLLVSSTSQDIDSLTPTLVQWNATTSDIMMSLTDRIEMKLYAVSDSTAQLTFYYEGSTNASVLITPIYTGLSGTSGTSGSSGTSGVGTSGTGGTSGSSGTSGVTGTSGTGGTSGSSGTSGATGTSGSSGTSGEGGVYLHTQSIASTVWNVTHNLDYQYVIAEVINDSDDKIMPLNIEYTDTTSLIITFSVARSGYVSISYGVGKTGSSGSSGTSGVGTSGSSGTSGIDGTRSTIAVVIKCIADNADLVVADGITHFTIPEVLDGMDLILVGAHVYTVSSSGLPTFEIYNLTNTVQMLTTEITIDVSEKDSKDATTPAEIDTANDGVVTGDELQFNCTVAGTDTKGMELRLTFG